MPQLAPCGQAGVCVCAERIQGLGPLRKRAGGQAVVHVGRPGLGGGMPLAVRRLTVPSKWHALNHWRN